MIEAPSTEMMPPEQTAEAVAGAYKRPDVPPGRKAQVGAWLSRIKNAEKKWDKDFKRMRQDMEFAAGVQWPGQGTIDSEQYVANLTNRHVAQKVSALYARDPKATAVVRERMDFTLWDGNPESVALAVQSLQMAMVGMGPLDPNAQALVNDYMHGMMVRDQLEKIGETLEKLYQWQVDQQEPEFKKQMKQLVRRVVTCGVGYVKLRIELPDVAPMTGDGIESNPATRLARAQALMREMSEDGATQDDYRVEVVRELLTSLSAGVDSAVTGISRLLFEFPVATALIPDTKCRQLKDFVGADWVAERFRRPRAEVEAFFETELCAEAYGEDTEQQAINGPSENQRTPDGDVEVCEPLVTLYEVFDKRSKSRFIVCVGHDDYVLAPEPVVPATKRFWPWFTLTFNDVEVEQDTDDVKASIFPPSDVHLLKHMQREWNRSREALREHRQGSIPFYVSSVPLTEADKQRLKAVEPNDVVQLESLPPGTDASKVLVSHQPAKIDPAVYDTAHVQQDVLMTVGTQEANFGPTSGATATESTIAEQSRVSNLSSNADDLDDLLTDMARAGGELMMRTMNEQEVKEIVGAGALWPPYEMVEQFACEVVLVIQAASSGRPNKALEISNFERMAPALLQAGVNPKFLVKEGVRRLDDRLPLDEAFPLMPQNPVPLPDTAQVPGETRGKPTTQNMSPAPGTV